jgi:hypothetical protein
MASMSTMRWFDRTQPQTLQVATMLLYIHVVFAFLYGTVAVFPWGFLIAALSFAGAFGCANERKWGYLAAIAAAASPFVFRLLFWNGYILTNSGIHKLNIIDKVTGRSPINLIFEAALVALVLHPMSRSYQRIWFK